MDIILADSLSASIIWGWSRAKLPTVGQVGKKVSERCPKSVHQFWIFVRCILYWRTHFCIGYYTGGHGYFSEAPYIILAYIVVPYIILVDTVAPYIILSDTYIYTNIILVERLSASIISMQTYLQGYYTGKQPVRQYNIHANCPPVNIRVNMFAWIL